MFAAIATGRNHNLALRTNGTVVGWGFNTYGQASPPSNLSNVVAIAAGYLHSAALLTNGTVVEWGDNTFGQTNMPPNLTNIIAIAAGDFHTYALRSDGTVIGWGDNTYQQTSIPPGLTNVIQLASGNYHGLAMIPAPPMLHALMKPRPRENGDHLDRLGNSAMGAPHRWDHSSTSRVQDVVTRIRIWQARRNIFACGLERRAKSVLLG